MKDLFVSYEQALQLKELGFNEPCLKVGNPNGHILWKFMDVLDVEGVDIGDIMKEKFDDRLFTFDALTSRWASGAFVEIPLKTQVFKWFREKYNIIGLIEGGFDIINIFTYCIWEGFKDKFYDDYYGTYEEAEDVLINILIDKVKNK
jgi:hypothetical protein